MYNQALNEQTKAVWDKCAPFAANFYLAGGTALALQIGHRISIDLDFFSAKPLDKGLLDQVESVFGRTVAVVVNNSTELTVLVFGVKVTFIYYPFKLKEELVTTSVVPLASVGDIASMKAYATGRRRSFKDYADLYILISKGPSTLTSIINDAKTTYGEAFNDRLFCEQLLSPEDLDDEPIIWLIDTVAKDDMKLFFEYQVKSFLNN